MGIPEQIRQLIRARIDAGQLPYAGFYEVFGRKGGELPCVCCDELITRQQTEYDVELSSGIGVITTLPMHVYCYRAWHEVASEIRRSELVAS
jgi:hypothetical protein